MKINNVDGYKLLTASFLSLYFLSYTLHYKEWHFIDAVNLIFHEAGHTLAFAFPQIIYIAAGSLFQILLPLFLSLYFFYDNQHFSGSVLLFWVGQNIINVSNYAGDAIVMQLPLIGGDNSIHDWNFILTYTHLLAYTDIIARALFSLGSIVLIAAALLSFVNAKRQPVFHVK